MADGRPTDHAADLADRAAALAGLDERMDRIDPDDLNERADRSGSDLRGSLGLNLSFRTRLTVGLVAASLIPLAGFGAILLILGTPAQSATLGRLLLFVLVVAAMIAILLA